MKQTKTIIKVMENHLNEIQSDQLRLEFANAIDRIKFNKDCRDYVLYELHHLFENHTDSFEDAIKDANTQSLPEYLTIINWINQNLLK